MKLLFVSLVFLRCSMMIGQTDKGFDIQGVLKLIDRAPTAIPIEGLVFHIHPLKGGLDIEARPDRAGRFTLNKVHPGPYSLTFPTPSRIQSFRYGSSELAADRFELTAGSAGVLTLVISDQPIFS